MATSWQSGPSYNPFIHTSNSQYGAWSGKPSSGTFHSSARNLPSSTTRQVNSYGAGSAARDVRAAEMSKIISTTDVTSRHKEKFTDFTTKYGSGRTLPMTSQYERTLLKNETFLPQKSAESGFVSSTGRPTGVPTTSVLSRNTMYEHGSGELTIAAHHNSDSKFGNYSTHALPSRSKDNTSIGHHTDLILNRSHSTLGATGLLDSHSKPSDTKDLTRDISRLTDMNNNFNNTKPFTSNVMDITTAVGRSNSFHGTTNPSSFGDKAPSTNPTSGRDHILSDKSYTISGSPGSRVTDPGMDHHIPRPPAYSAGAGEHGRNNSRSAMYWLYGVRNRSGHDSSSIAEHSTPLIPYKPGDYLFKSETNELSNRRYSAPMTQHHEGPEKQIDNGHLPQNDILGSLTSSALERHRVNTGSTIPYPLESSNSFNTSRGNATSGYDRMDINDNKVPEIMSTNSGTGLRSILKKGDRSSSGIIIGNSLYTYHEVPSYTRGAFHTTDAKHLPPLSVLTTGAAGSATLSKNSSGKRVTFNMALNRSRPIINHL